MPVRDIFREGPSPELQARWDELESAIAKFQNSFCPEEKKELLQKYPEIRGDVICCECAQELPTYVD